MNLALLQDWRKDKKYPIKEQDTLGRGYKKRNTFPPKRIVIHTTNGAIGTSFNSEARFLLNSDEVSTHYIVGKKGEIAECLPPEFEAYHAGKTSMLYTAYQNPHSIGIEVHYTPGEGEWTHEMWVALTDLVLFLKNTYNIPSTLIEMHRTIAPGRKIDPSGISNAQFYAWRNTLAAQTPAQNTNKRVYTTSSSFINFAPPYDPEWAVNMIMSPQCKYTKDQVRVIVREYVQCASQVGLDWWLILSQCIHETGKLSSWWCEEPRRNYAGLGVTGETQTKEPLADGQWAYDPHTMVWKKGLSFGFIELGVRVHIGHLLSYIYKDQEMSPQQLLLSNISPRKKTLPSNYRGSTKEISGLTQRWAYSKILPSEGQRYHDRILRIANSM